MLTNGRRCPNTALPGSAYCGLTQHQALRRFRTNSVTLLADLSQDEIARLADPSVPDDGVADIVARVSEPEEEAPPVEDAAQEGDDPPGPFEEGAEALAGAPVEGEGATEGEPTA